MNKLISRNPVQRFKQGRKIVKAQWGFKTREDGVIVNNAGIPVGKSIMGSSYEYEKYFPKDKLILPGLYQDKDTKEIFSTNSTDSNGDYNQVMSGPSPIQNGTYYETKDSSGKIIDRGRYFGGKKHSLPIGGTQRKRAYYQVDPKDGSKYLIGTDGSKTLVSKGNKSNNSSRTRVNNKSNNVQQRNPGAYHNITTWQNKLKDFYAPGTFKVDGIWGKNTEAAYQKYLQSQKTPNEIKEEAWQNAPQSQDKVYTNKIIPSINTLAPRINAVLNSKQIAEDINVPYEIRAKAAMGMLKKGGQLLPFRNVVTRFKMRVKQ